MGSKWDDINWVREYNREANRRYRDRKKQEIKLRHKKWRDENKDKVAQYARQTYLKNKEKKDQYLKEYRNSHPGWMASLCKKKRELTKRATPSWVDMDRIKEIYILAKHLKMSVDHIIPINSDTVCGLHVPWNLQIITIQQNSRKHTKYDA